MATGFGNIPVDAGGIPMSTVWVPGEDDPIAIAGSPNTTTDGNGNESTPVALDLQQINDLPVAMAGTDGVNATTLLQFMPSRFNGLSADMHRGNMDNIQVISATAVTTTQTAHLTNYNGRGCIIVLQTTAIGTGSITLEIDGVEPVTSATWQILVGTAVTTNTTKLYKVYPSLAAVANSVAADVLPRSFNVVVTANNTNPANYTVAAIILE